MQYGAILGKHQEISRAELRAQGITIDRHYWSVAIFTVEESEKEITEETLKKLAGIVKWGVVIQPETIEAQDLIGASERALGTFLKKRGVCRRYKEVDPLHTDMEVKEKGTEYVMLDEEYQYVLQVIWYQDISRFSTIDFDKPVNSMQIGMMPGKLTQIMVNIGVGKWKQMKKESLSWEETWAWLQQVSTEGASRSDITVYDPFMGLGTTAMIANSMWYNVIGSDINITPCKQNMPWWKEQKIAQSLPITLFAHDVTQPFNKPFLQHASCVVTEWWLGHIVNAKTKPADVALYAQDIEKVYKARISNSKAFWEHMIIVCAIPRYTSHEHSNNHVTRILQHCEEKGMRVETVTQVYTRPWQKVWRKIAILSW